MTNNEEIMQCDKLPWLKYLDKLHYIEQTFFSKKKECLGDLDA